MQSFQNGITIEFLSQKFNFSKLTIVRNLKKSLGKSKYDKFIKMQKSYNSVVNDKDINLKKEIEVDTEKLHSKNNFLEVNSDNQIGTEIENEFFQDSSFFEIAPLNCEIDNVNRKDVSSVPISEINFPKTVYMIVDRKIELETKFLRDYPEWEFLPNEDLDRECIEIYNDLKTAKRLCNKEQKVIKVPNTDVFKLVSHFLIARGISRIVYSEQLIAL